MSVSERMRPSIDHNENNDDRVREIALHHQRTIDNLRGALDAAIAAGHLLIQIKQQLPRPANGRPGVWQQWLREHEAALGFSYPTAAEYMRFARFEAIVREHGAVHCLDARNLLAVRSSYRADIADPTLVEEAKRLRGEGLTLTEIGDQLGFSRQAIGIWINHESRRERDRRRSERSRRAAQALRREELRQVARRVGGDLGESYSLIRKALDNLERASTQYSGGARSEIRSTMSSLHNAEDKIAKALKLAVVE